MACVMARMQKPLEQFPQLVFLIGGKIKDGAMCQLCQANHHRTHYQCHHIITLQANNASIQSTYPRIFADFNPTCQVVVCTLDSSQLCHHHESVPIQWPDSLLDPFHLILARLLFLFCNVICIFADDVGGLEAVQSLLTMWATIGSTSSLPETICPHIIVITGRDNNSITQALLDEDFFLLQMLKDAPFLFTFMDINML
ncbi:hypothetical protein FQN50_006137 [Emmonsiellopsis sp. PD_5]|nr:hypothetical protein FQN50_006137 [Emmonsiellopsis sp. PD_5]